MYLHITLRLYPRYSTHFVHTAREIIIVVKYFMGKRPVIIRHLTINRDVISKIVFLLKNV